jgi:1-acyl-sn-glycerol-3-phosphate acyltransferase
MVCRHPPVYRFSPALVARALAAFALGRGRDLARDAEQVLAGLPVHPRATGEGHIPTAGSFVLVANHYERPGLWVGWGALLITATVARQRPGRPPIRWVHISQWTRYRFYGIVLPTGFTRRLIKRASRIWGLIPIPPPGRTDAGDAWALLRAAHVVADGRGRVLGLFPEGAPSVELRPAVPGSGSFLLRLSERGIPIVPVGLAEPDGVLTARFGPTFQLTVRSGIPPGERDAVARQEVMAAIGRQLPPELRGTYRGERGADATGVLASRPGAGPQQAHGDCRSLVHR